MGSNPAGYTNFKPLNSRGLSGFFWTLSHYEKFNCQVELFLVSMYKKTPNIQYRKKTNLLSKV